MLTFLGLLVIAAVLYFGLRRLILVVGAIGTVFERTVNRAAMRGGNEPITTPEDEERYR